MRLLRSLAAAVTLITAAVLVLPGSVGGSTSYVRTYGNSMEPTLQAGDLAILRQSARYEVGDIAAYRSPELDRVVLHRVVERRDDTLIFQGDNNEFRDRELIAPTDVLGRLALRVPSGGSVLSWLQQPPHAAGLAGTLGALPLLIAGRRRRTQLPNPLPTRGTPMNPFPVTQLQRATPWLAAGALASLLVGALVLASPAAGVSPEAPLLTHTGTFSYSAPSSSALYPRGFSSGDPVFTRLSDQVTVAFNHEAKSASEVEATGTVRIEAVLSGSGGWRRDIALVDPQPLADGPTTVRALLGLRELQALGDEAATVTGTAAGPLRVDITPVVELRGALGDYPLDDRFAPTLAFTLDPAALRLAAPAAGSAGGLVQTRDVTLGRPSPPPTRSMGILGALPLPSSGAPGFLAGGILLALATAYAHSQVRRAGGPGPVSLRYAHLLVPVEGVTRSAGRPVVHVATMADLVRLAKHHDQLVLHQRGEGRHDYIVELGSNTFVYRPGT